MSAKYLKKANLKRIEQGFTLVELAIVLVVIGFIVSGVLVGQDLIKAAQLRAVSRQFNEFQVGVTTFINKYNGIPGDVNNGGKFGLTGTATYQDGTTGAGDGDGTITQDNAATVLVFTGEMSTFWSHLTTSGKELISGYYTGNGCTAATVACLAGTDFPKIIGYSHGWGVFGASGVNYLLAGAESPGSATALTRTIDTFIPNDAYAIDVKIDDGFPASGNVQGRDGHATVIDTLPTPAAASTSATTCNTNATPNEYQYQVTTAQCTLRFQLQTF